ncbi:hypothetical protein D9M70_372960 [compost metagenome]
MQRHVADLVEEQGAAIGLLDQAAHTLAAGSGEGSGLVTEQLALDQGFRHRRAIDGDEGSLAPVAAVVQRAGKALLAGAGFAIEQHIQRLAAQALGAGEHLAHGRVVVRQFVERAAFLRRSLGLRGQRRTARLHQGGEEQGVLAVGAEGAHLVRAGVGNAEDVAWLAVEQVLDADPAGQRRWPFRQLQATVGEKPACRRVGREQAAVARQRQQVLAVDQDELAGAVEAENVGVAVAPQEVGVFDHPRVLLDQLQGELLRILRGRRIQRRDVQHRQQLPLGIEDRHRGAGQGDVVGAEVIVMMAGQRRLLLDAGAHRAGAGVVLAPVRAEVEAGLAMGCLVQRVAEELHGDAAVVGEQDHVAQLGDMPVELLDAGAGDIDQLVGLVLVLAQYLARDIARRRGLRRVEAVVLDAALPGAGDDGLAADARLRRIGSVGEHGVDVQARGRDGAHAASSDTGEAPRQALNRDIRSDDLVLVRRQHGVGGLARLRTPYEFRPWASSVRWV